MHIAWRSWRDAAKWPRYIGQWITTIQSAPTDAGSADSSFQVPRAVRAVVRLLPLSFGGVEGDCSSHITSYFEVECVGQRSGARVRWVACLGIVLERNA